jgi:hypothetical protein
LKFKINLKKELKNSISWEMANYIHLGVGFEG